MVKYGRSEPRIVAPQDAVVYSRALAADDSGDGESSDEGFDDCDFDDKSVEDGISDAASDVQKQVSDYTRATASCGQEKEDLPPTGPVVDENKCESATASEEVDLSAAAAGAKTPVSAYTSTTGGSNEEKGRLSPSKKRTWSASEEEVESAGTSEDASISTTTSNVQTTVSAYGCTAEACGVEGGGSSPAKRARCAANEEESNGADIDKGAAISRAADGPDTHAAEYVSTTAYFDDEMEAQLFHALTAFNANFSQATHTEAYGSMPQRNIVYVGGAAYQSLVHSYPDEGESDDDDTHWRHKVKEYDDDDDDEWSMCLMLLGDAEGSWEGLRVCLTPDGLFLDVN